MSRKRQEIRPKLLLIFGLIWALKIRKCAVWNLTLHGSCISFWRAQACHHRAPTTFLSHPYKRQFLRATAYML